MKDIRLDPQDEARSSRLPEPLARAFRDPVDERSLARVWRRVETARAMPRAPVGMVLRWSGAGAALAVVVMLLIGQIWQVHTPMHQHHGETKSSQALLQKSGAPIPVVDVARGGGPLHVELADGSNIVAEPGTRLEPLALTGREVVLRLVHGVARFEVFPGGPRRWLIEAGPASVEVVGTGFSVDRSDVRVSVSVIHGIVLVRGASLPDGVKRLEAGESVEVRPTTSEATVPTPSSAPASPRDAAKARTPAPSSASGASSWRDAARSGSYASAYGTLGADGLRAEATRARSVGELLTLADVARLSGHPDEAVGPLERLVSEYPSDSRAALAAVTLGRIELALGHPARASAVFDRALAVGIPAGLAEDVYALRVQALVKAGQRSAARAAATEYERRFPAGHRLNEIQQWLAR